jgi:autophagy-related protein 9
MSVYREPDSNPGETSPTHKLSSSSRSTMLSASTTRSQPFLNMLNPIGNGRRYAGYAQARQDAVPEEEDDEGENTERENIPLASTSNRPQSQSKSRRGAVTPSSADLRPNIHSASTGGDALDSSDDEVPQSFMIETHARPRTPKSRGKDRARTSSRPSHKDKDKHQRHILPVGAELPTNLSIPPRPSEISSPGHDPFDDNADLDDGTSASTAPPRPQMRGLDAYERALWNWVNVYNLDAFLQEVYFYYEGKGIYCIALARVLNLLCV